MAKGDFNGDGALDIFAVGFKRFGAELDRHHWYVLLGNGDGTFQGPIDSVETTTAIGGDLQLASPNARDLDGDGKLDILMAWYTKKQVLFLKGNGNGITRPPVASTLPVAASNIAIGDLNGDGKLDIVVNDTASSTIATATGDGTGKFASPASYTTHGTAGYLLLGDFSGDGKPDVVYSVYGSPNFGLFLNNGSGALSASPLLISAGGKDVSNVTIGDYNADGKLDVLVMGQGGNVANVTSFAAVLMRGNGNGTFNHQAKATTPTTWARLAE